MWNCFYTTGHIFLRYLFRPLRYREEYLVSVCLSVCLSELNDICGFSPSLLTGIGRCTILCIFVFAALCFLFLLLWEMVLNRWRGGLCIFTCFS